MNPVLASVFPGATANDLGLSRTRIGQTEESLPLPNAHTPHHLEVDSAPGDSTADGAGGTYTEALADERVLSRLRNGDREALAILFRRYARMVRAVAYRILRNGPEADDLLQEVFLFIFHKAALFDATRGTARSWIVQVTYHRAIDRRRYLTSRHFYTSVELEDAVALAGESRAEVAFYEQSIEGTLGRETLSKIAESLSEDQRKVIQLYFFEGYTLEEIAGLLVQSTGNIRNHYYRGLDKMRKHIFAAKLQAK